MKMRGFCTSTRVSATNCRCPIDSRRTSLTHITVQSIRQSLQPFSCANAPRHGFDFGVAGFGPAVADVIGDSAGKEERNLRDDAQLLPVRFQIEGADILPVDLQFTFLKLVETGDELDDAGFACPGVADQRHAFPGCMVRVNSRKTCSCSE
jgi:hypothetical protein